ncbi:hypothetical protein [Haladaptatus sp. T7]|uniref:hypothetical protein n=1 Tax=Haladaptatus sp. T7 TaxID=2029368 RepID=UPI0021A25558|nr:hypothetical protein [Haladaptatus sp. T7]GKZ15299.1 hypothetical protein HAL_31800 [Haladaptatus sp. T7]
MSNESISGYDRASEVLPAPPISTGEFDRLKQSIMFTDEEYLDRMRVRIVGEGKTGVGDRVKTSDHDESSPSESRSVDPAGQ